MSDSLRDKLKSTHNKLFEEALKGSDSKLLFFRLGTGKIPGHLRTKDALGEEMKVIEQASTSPLKQFFGSAVNRFGTTRNFNVTGKGPLVEQRVHDISRRLVEASQQLPSGDPFNPRLGSFNPKTSYIMLGWDAESQANLVKGITKGGSKSVFVPVKKILNAFFGEVPWKEVGKAESVIQQIADSTDDGGIRYLREALEQVTGGGSGTNIGPDQMMHTIFNGAFMRASAAGSDSPYGIEFFKKMLSNFGVEGLSIGGRPLWNSTDPNGMTSILAGIKAGSIETGMDLAEAGQLKFFGAVSDFFGGKYANVLEDAYMQLREAGGDQVNMVLSGKGGVFVGKRGFSGSYVSLPAEVMGDPGAISKMGFPAGVMTHGNRQFSGRKVAVGTGQISHLSPMHIKSFVKAAISTPGSGMNDRSIIQSLSKAHQEATREAIIGNSDTTFDILRGNLTSRGRLSMYSALYDAHTFSAGNAAYARYNAKSQEIAKLQSQGVLPPDEVKSLMHELDQDLQQQLHIKHNTNALAPAIKGQAALERGLVPLRSIGTVFLPSVLDTTNAREKGRYAARGVEEIYDPIHINAIKGSRAAAGMLPRASTLGVTAGNMSIMEGLNAAYSSPSQLPKAIGVKGIGHGAVGFPLLVQIPHFSSEYAARARGFGDAGALMTLGNAGRPNVFQRSRVTHSVQGTMNTTQFTDFLSRLSGGSTSDEWQAILKADPQKLLAGSENLRMKIPLPKNIDPSLGVPKDARYLTGMTGSIGRADMKFFFGTSDLSNPPQESFLVNQMHRMTARMAHPHQLRGAPGTQEAIAAGRVHGDIITSRFNLNPTDPTAVFHHRTGMLGLPNRPAGASIEAFVAGVNKRAGVTMLEHVRGGEEYIKHTEHFTDRGFKTASRLTMQAMGYSHRSILGYMHGLHDLEGKAIKGQEGVEEYMSLPGRTVSLRGIAKKERLLALSGNLREGATEGILQQKNAIRVRLNTFGDIIQGARSMGYSKPFMHPLIALFGKQLEDSSKRAFGGSGLLFNKGEGTSRATLLKETPLELRRILAPYQEGALNTLGAEVLTLEQARTKFGQGPGRLTLGSLDNSHGGAINYEDLLETKLFKNENGFFIDIGEQYLAPSSGKSTGGKEAARLSNHVYVGPGKFLSRMVEGGEGSPVNLKEGDMVHSIAALLSPNRGPNKDVNSAVRDATSLTRSYVRLGGKDAKLDKTFFSASWGGAGNLKGRLVSTIDSTTALSDLVNNPTFKEEMFEVGISRSTISDAVSSSSEAKRILAMLDDGKHVYSVMQPTPVHGIGHLRLVRLKLDATLEGISSTEPGLAMSPLQLFAVNRDLDQDVADMLILESRHLETIEKLTGDRSSMSHLRNTGRSMSIEKLWKNQLSMGPGLHAQFVRSLKTDLDFKPMLGRPKNKEDALRMITALFSFGGSTPALPFTAMQSAMELSTLIKDPKDPGYIAKKINSISRQSQGTKNQLNIPFTAEHIEEYSSALGTRAQVSRASTYNMAPRQGGIQKAGAFLSAINKYYLSMQHSANIAYAQGRSHQDFIHGIDGKGGTIRGVRSLIDEMGVKFQMHASSTIVDPAADVAEVLGRTLGISSWIRAKHYEAGSRGLVNIVFDAIRSENPTLDKLSNLAYPGQEMLPPLRESIELLTSSQEALADLDPDLPDGLPKKAKGSTKAAKDMLKKIMSSKVKSFFRNNWKLIGGVGAGLIGANILFGSDDLEPPSYGGMMSPGGLPPQPLISMAAPGPFMQNTPARAYVTPDNGAFSNDSYRGTASAVNINESTSNFMSNFGSFNNLRATMTVSDSRSYSNNYKMQQVANMHADSDFIHRFMGTEA